MELSGAAQVAPLRGHIDAEVARLGGDGSGDKLRGRRLANQKVGSRLGCAMPSACLHSHKPNSEYENESTEYIAN